MKAFRMEDHEPKARKIRLEPSQGMALAKAMELAAKMAQRTGRKNLDEDMLRDFLLPFTEFGLEAPHMLALLEKVPPDWPLDHREMYYDFRLARWQKHIEPPTLAGCLDEYLENSPSPAEGEAYVREEWARFLSRHGLK
jgi:hypothetical protein